MTVLLVALVLVSIAVAYDLTRREIPDWISVALVLLAIVAGFLGDPSWGSRALGLGIGLALGAALFARGGLGGGDVKLITALGAVLGWKDLLWLLFFMALAGGVIGLVAKVRGRRDVAYAPAIAIGLAAVTVITGVMRHAHAH